MIQNNRGLPVEVLKVFDLVTLLFSFLFVAVISSLPAGPVGLFDAFPVRIRLADVVLALLFAEIWHLILCSCKLYVSRRLCYLSAEILDIVKATSVALLLLYLLAPVFGIRMINASFVFLLWANTTLLIILGRLILRWCLTQLRIRGINHRNILIAGVHHRAMLFAGEILSRPELGYHLLGFVDDDGEKSPELELSGHQLVATFDSFNDYLRSQMVDEVAICLPIKSHYQQAAQVAAICEEHGIVVRFLSDIFNPRLARAMTQQFEGHSIITFYTGNMYGGDVVVKRVFDVALSLVLILVLSPLFLLAALLVRCSSQGPVLFIQQRLGLNKHHFGLYKFRTMYSDAEARQAELEHLNEVQGAAFKIRNDPRITPLGKILRRTSIDELPQLFNVLKGEMSLVGPRPLPIRDYSGFDKDWHRRRFSVRPGITCLWQISGRSGISFDTWMKLDMEYIDNWSLWLDLKILLGTIPAVLKGSGAV